MPKLGIFLPCRISYRTSQEAEDFLKAEGRRRGMSGQSVSAVARAMQDDQIRLAALSLASSDTATRRGQFLALMGHPLIKETRRVTDANAAGRCADSPKRRKGDTKKPKGKAKRG